MPAANDPGHLPGGNAAREAVDAATLLGTQFDLGVSSAAPADATYVGTGVCVSCHGRDHISETMHRIGIWKPGDQGLLQNIEPRFDDLYMAIDNKFKLPGGTTNTFMEPAANRSFEKNCATCHAHGAQLVGSDTTTWSLNAVEDRFYNSGDFDFDGNGIAEETFYATTQLDAAPGSLHADPDSHSKSHHQQYSDLIRSAMYKNDEELVTCTDCHATETGDLEVHLTLENIPLSTNKAEVALCTDCHMTKTAKSGAGNPALVISGVQYWENDITSHLFKFPDRSLANPPTSMSEPYTNACVCHAAIGSAPQFKAGKELSRTWRPGFYPGRFFS